MGFVRASRFELFVIAFSFLVGGGMGHSVIDLVSSELIWKNGKVNILVKLQDERIKRAQVCVRTPGKEDHTPLKEIKPDLHQEFSVPVNGVGRKTLEFIIDSESQGGVCTQEEESRDVKILSPFNHWEFWEATEDNAWRDVSSEDSTPNLLSYPLLNRASLTGKLTRALKSDKHSVVWLHGLPGCGKTTQLVRYIKARGEDLPFYIVYMGYDGKETREWSLKKRLANSLCSRPPFFRFDPHSTLKNLLEHTANYVHQQNGQSLLLVFDGFYPDESLRDFALEVISAVAKSNGLSKVIVTDVLPLKRRLDQLEESEREWLVDEVIDKVVEIEVSLFSEKEIREWVKKAFDQGNGTFLPSVLVETSGSALFEHTGGYPFLLAHFLSKSELLYNSKVLDKSISWGNILVEYIRDCQERPSDLARFVQKLKEYGLVSRDEEMLWNKICELGDGVSIRERAWQSEAPYMQMLEDKRLVVKRRRSREDAFKAISVLRDIKMH